MQANINLKYLLENKHQLNASDTLKIEQAISLYPYCQTLYILWAKALYLNDREKFQKNLSFIALAVGDRGKLYHIIHDISPIETDLEEKLTYVSTDYFFSEKEETIESQHKTKQDLLIDSFILNNPQISISLDREETDEEDVMALEEEKEEEFFSETLAKVYIKQKHYEKAIKIFEKLSLKYPEKNVYFADQIRFLKIIVNNNKKK